MWERLQWQRTRGQPGIKEAAASEAQPAAAAAANAKPIETNVLPQQFVANVPKTSKKIQNNF